MPSDSAPPFSPTSTCWDKGIATPRSFCFCHQARELHLSFSENAPWSIASYRRGTEQALLSTCSNLIIGIVRDARPWRSGLMSIIPLRRSAKTAQLGNLHRPQVGLFSCFLRGGDLGSRLPHHPQNAKATQYIVSQHIAQTNLLRCISIRIGLCLFIVDRQRPVQMTLHLFSWHRPDSK
jgi:hypothetical protein